MIERTGESLHAPALTGTTQTEQPKSADAFSDLLQASLGKVDLEPLFAKASTLYNVPNDLLKAVAKVESGFNTNAVSKAGAMGIMQLMPSTAAGLGVDNPLDPEQNIMGGARMLHQLLNRYDGDLTLTLAAYNAGVGNVAKYDGVPPFAETNAFIERVTGYYKGGGLQAGYAAKSAPGAAVPGVGVTGSDALVAEASLLSGKDAAIALISKLLELEMKDENNDH
jgi:hypothetical protein